MDSVDAAGNLELHPVGTFVAVGTVAVASQNYSDHHPAAVVGGVVAAFVENSSPMVVASFHAKLGYHN